MHIVLSRVAKKRLGDAQKTLFITYLQFIFWKNLKIEVIYKTTLSQAFRAVSDINFPLLKEDEFDLSKNTGLYFLSFFGNSSPFYLPTFLKDIFTHYLHEI